LINKHNSLIIDYFVDNGYNINKKLMIDIESYEIMKNKRDQMMKNKRDGN